MAFFLGLSRDDILLPHFSNLNHKSSLKHKRQEISFQVVEAMVWNRPGNGCRKTWLTDTWGQALHPELHQNDPIPSLTWVIPGPGPSSIHYIFRSEVMYLLIPFLITQDYPGLLDDIFRWVELQITHFCLNLIKRKLSGRKVESPGRDEPMAAIPSTENYEVKSIHQSQVPPELRGDFYYSFTFQGRWITL